MSDKTGTNGELPDDGKIGKSVRGALQIAGGAVPLLGGFLSAFAGAWSEHDQAKVNRFFQQWMRMLEEELREKETTILEIMARIDLQDSAVADRVEIRDFQSLVKKAFRDWAGAESEDKRILIRNLLANAAAARLASDDVVRLFIDWIRSYSELHFKVIGAIYKAPRSTRGQVWRNIGKGQVREDSADADLYKLLFRDLSTGSVIRQHRETDRWGNFIAKPTRSRDSSGDGRTLVSAFDDIEPYELTDLGRQFVHYAMNELTSKIEFRYKPPSNSADEAAT
jgi:hypothetical protein